MIIIRFKETFRERLVEWGLSAGLLAWGLITLYSPGLFIDQEFFHPMLRIMAQTSWGIITSLIGIIRLIFLVINGGWRPSAHIRAIGASAGSIIWASLLMGAMSLGWLTPTSGLYALLLVFDLMALWFASGDAKIADVIARSKKGVK